MESDYEVIQFSGELPDQFLVEDPSNSVGVDLNLYDTQVNNPAKEKFRAVTDFAQREILLSGLVYFNDPIVGHVKSVAKRLLANHPQGNEIKIFITRNTGLSATAWEDGTLFISVGLLSRLENDDQLAFVIAHEFSHFLEGHPFYQYVEKMKVKSVQKRTLDKLRTRLAYSKSHEFEADAKALQIMKTSPFDGREGRKVIQLLLGTNQIHSLDPSRLNSKAFDFTNVKKCFGYESKTFMLSDRNSEVPDHFPLLYLQQREDQLFQALPGGESLAEPSEAFLGIRDIAHFELVENLFNESNFVRSIYESLILQKKYPLNVYLRSKIAESLYNISLFELRKIKDRLFFDKGTIQEEAYASLSCQFTQIKEDDLLKLSKGYIADQYELLGNYDETISIIMAKFADIYAGKKESKPFFEQHLLNFPKGEHSAYARQKLYSETKN